MSGYVNIVMGPFTRQFDARCMATSNELGYHGYHVPAVRRTWHCVVLEVQSSQSSLHESAMIAWPLRIQPIGLHTLVPLCAFHPRHSTAGNIKVIYNNYGS